MPVLSWLPVNTVKLRLSRECGTFLLSSSWLDAAVHEHVTTARVAVMLL